MINIPEYFLAKHGLIYQQWPNLGTTWKVSIAKGDASSNESTNKLLVIEEVMQTIYLKIMLVLIMITIKTTFFLFSIINLILMQTVFNHHIRGEQLQMMAINIVSNSADDITWGFHQN